MKHVIVLNPLAGVNNKPEVIKDKVNEAFHDLDYLIYETKGTKDATRFVKEFLIHNTDDIVRFYSCGGDGTLNEIANGLIEFDNAELACYPIGSGNDFIKYFGKADDFLDFRSLINGKSIKTDVIEFDGHYIVNVFNVGFDAVVCELQRKYKKLPLISGKGAYNLGVIMALLRKIAHKFIIKVDGEEFYNGKVTLCAVANAKCYGGGYYCAPNADVSDGKIDICVVKKVSRFTFAKLVKDYKAGRHVTSPKFSKHVLYKQGKIVEIDIEKPLYYTIDGENNKTSKIKLSVLSNKLKFVIPLSLRNV